MDELMDHLDNLTMAEWIKLKGNTKLKRRWCADTKTQLDPLSKGILTSINELDLFVDAKQKLTTLIYDSSKQPLLAADFAPDCQENIVGSWFNDATGRITKITLHEWRNSLMCKRLGAFFVAPAGAGKTTLVKAGGW
jgi:hypothetical protein